MLSPEDNALLTQSGPGTPLGGLMRRYWIPFLLSSELPEPDCPPVRVTLLGEGLVAYRDSKGRVGLLDRHCAHRGASLFFGRNEECGLRCVYHGWKYDLEGHCVDMPNEPPESNFKDKVRIKAYPCRERGGMVWTYMGPPELMPGLPEFEFLMGPDNQRYVTKRLQECNWLQALEGGRSSTAATTAMTSARSTTATRRPSSSSCRPTTACLSPPGVILPATSTTGATRRG
jgi:nitrite reductase/ring-hydroxylating ferredoxin subunit